MRVLGIICSSEGGNTDILMQEALAGASYEGAEPEALNIFNVGEKGIAFCRGRFECRKTGVCTLDDDMQVIYEKLLVADGIIFGVPIIQWSVGAQAKNLMERLIALQSGLRLANKVGALITAAARRGTTNVWNVFFPFFVHNHMLIAEFVDGYARERGAISQDRYAMKASWELGRQVALLTRQHFEFPKEFSSPLYQYVPQKYGISVCPVG